MGGWNRGGFELDATGLVALCPPIPSQSHGHVPLLPHLLALQARMASPRPSCESPRRPRRCRRRGWWRPRRRRAGGRGGGGIHSRPGRVQRAAVLVTASLRKACSIVIVGVSSVMLAKGVGAVEIETHPVESNRTNSVMSTRTPAMSVQAQAGRVGAMVRGHNVTTAPLLRRNKGRPLDHGPSSHVGGIQIQAEHDGSRGVADGRRIWEIPDFPRRSRGALSGPAKG